MTSTLVLSIFMLVANRDAFQVEKDSFTLVRPRNDELVWVHKHLTGAADMYELELDAREIDRNRSHSSSQVYAGYFSQIKKRLDSLKSSGLRTVAEQPGVFLSKIVRGQSEVRAIVWGPSTRHLSLYYTNMVGWTTFDPQVGDRVKIDEMWSGGTPAAFEPGVLEAIIDAQSVGNFSLASLYLSGNQAFLVKSSDRVALVEDGDPYARIKGMSGRLAGKYLYLPSESIESIHEKRIKSLIRIFDGFLYKYYDASYKRYEAERAQMVARYKSGLKTDRVFIKRSEEEDRLLLRIRGDVNEWVSVQHRHELKKILDKYSQNEFLCRLLSPEGKYEWRLLNRSELAQ